MITPHVTLKKERWLNNIVTDEPVEIHVYILLLLLLHVYYYYIEIYSLPVSFVIVNETDRGKALQNGGSISSLDFVFLFFFF